MPDFCGNPFHDIPAWSLFIFSFFLPAFFWLRARLGCTCKNKCHHNHELIAHEEDRKA